MAPWPRLLHHLDGDDGDHLARVRRIMVPHTGDQLPEGEPPRSDPRRAHEARRREAAPVHRWVSFAEF